MKKLIVILSLLLSVCYWVGCTQLQAAPPKADKNTGRVDTVSPDAALGRALREYFDGYVYYGGVRQSCRLLMDRREHSGNGTFRMSCLTGTSLSMFSGERYILRGTLKDNNATVIQLVADSAEFRFLSVGDSLLLQLSDSDDALPDTFALKRQYLNFPDAKDNVK